MLLYHNLPRLQVRLLRHHRSSLYLLLSSLLCPLSVSLKAPPVELVNLPAPYLLLAFHFELRLVDLEVILLAPLALQPRFGRPHARRAEKPKSAWERKGGEGAKDKPNLFISLCLYGDNLRSHILKIFALYRDSRTQTGDNFRGLAPIDRTTYEAFSVTESRVTAR